MASFNPRLAFQCFLLLLTCCITGCDSGVTGDFDSGCGTSIACDSPECADNLLCNACEPRCGACEQCQDGVCAPILNGRNCESGRCYEGQCCAGCWDGMSCQAGAELNACGGGGTICETCRPPNDACAEGLCVQTAEARVFAGGRHTCLLNPEGILRCSGANETGQLGLDDREPRWTPTPMAWESESTFARVAVGEGHLCALTRTGRVGCSGSNNLGQLGTRDNIDRQRLTAIASERAFVFVAAGRGHSCAINEEGLLYCWGNNFYGQLGLGDTGNRPAPTSIGIEQWQAIAIGDEHTCGVREGELFCWGNNSSGQLGNGENTPMSIPESILDNVSRFSLGVGHTCAVTNAGELYCWGQNMVGQLGLGDSETRRLPTRVGTANDWAGVAAGTGHTCGWTQDGRVFCFGRNVFGELGSGDENPSNAPLEVMGLSGIVEVSLGSDHSCASDASGNTWCWGSNASGQLGGETPSASNTATPYPSGG